MKRLELDPKSFPRGTYVTVDFADNEGPAPGLPLAPLTIAHDAS